MLKDRDDIKEAIETGHKASSLLKEVVEFQNQIPNSIYQILGKYGVEYEDIKSEFRELAEYLK